MTLAQMPDFTPTKASKAEDVAITGTISTDNAVQMTVSSEGAAHIMGLLTDLYSDPNLAVLREYSSNAYDSHVEAGQTRPVEITTPTALSPQFVVTDFGVGMSPDAIRHIYSSYGASTKRNDFTQVGAFGLGCKSALTLTQSFTLTSRKDGVQTTAIISRGEDGVGTVNVVSEVPTSEPNGVVVNIPISEVNDFNRNVESFFFGWKKGTVLVDGREPRSIFDADYIESKSKFFHYRFDANYGARSGFEVLMGGVLYKVDMRSITYDSGAANSPQAIMANIVHSQASIVSEIPIGAVDLTPSREAVRYSERSKKFLGELFVQISTEIMDTMSESISKAPTRGEALKLLRDYDIVVRSTHRNRIGASTIPLKWRSNDIPMTFKVTGLDCDIDKNGSAKYGRSSVIEVTDSPYGHNGVFGNSFDRERFFVVETDPDKIAKIRREFRYYFHKNCEQPYKAQLFIVSEMPTDPWITENELYKFINAEDIFKDAAAFRKENRENIKKAPQPQKIYYYTCVIKGSSGNVEKTTIGHDSLCGLHMYYVKFDDSSTFEEIYRGGYGVPTRLKRVQEAWDELGLHKNSVIILLPRTWSLEALQKRIAPRKVSNLMDKVQKHVEGLTTPSAEVIEAASIFSEGYSFLNTILKNTSVLGAALKKCPDPDIAALGKVSKEGREYLNRWSKIGDCFHLSRSRSTNPVVRTDLERRARALSSKYPLLNIGSSVNSADLDKYSEHAMLYIKAVVEATKERTS